MKASQDGPAPPESDLARELAELRTLHAQLAALEKDVSKREKWLAEAMGTTPLPPDLIDCDGVACAIQAAFRKMRYAAKAGLPSIITGADKEDNKNPSDLDRTIPLPPWRKPHNATDTDPPNPADPIEDDSDDNKTTWASIIAVVVFCLPLLPVIFISLCILVFAAICAVLAVLFPVICVAELVRAAVEGIWNFLAPPGGEAHRRCSAVWGRVMGGVGVWRRGRGQDTLGDEERDGERTDSEYRDEKGEGDVLDEKEEAWDEKAGSVVVEEEVVESEGESEGESENESVGDYAESDSEDGLTLGDEISSFRSALALVEDLVAETASRERRGDSM